MNMRSQVSRREFFLIDNESIIPKQNAVLDFLKETSAGRTNWQQVAEVRVVAQVRVDPIREGQLFFHSNLLPEGAKT